MENRVGGWRGSEQRRGGKTDWVGGRGEAGVGLYTGAVIGWGAKVSRTCYLLPFFFFKTTSQPEEKTPGQEAGGKQGEGARWRVREKR